MLLMHRMMGTVNNTPLQEVKPAGESNIRVNQITNSNNYQPNPKIQNALNMTAIDHLTTALASLHTFDFIRSLFSDNMVIATIDDGLMSGDFYCEVKCYFLAAVISNQPTEALDGYLRLVKCGIEAANLSGCNIFEMLYNREDPDLYPGQFDRCLTNSLISLLQQVSINAQIQLPGSIYNNVKVSGNQSIVALAGMLGKSFAVYNRKTVNLYKVKIFYGLGSSFTYHIFDRHEDALQMTYKDLRARIGNKLRYSYMFIEATVPISGALQKSSLYLNFNTCAYIKEEAKVFLSGSNTRTVAVARFALQIGDFEDIIKSVDHKDLIDCSFFTEKLNSSAYVTARSFGLEPLIKAVSIDLENLVMNGSKHKVLENLKQFFVMSLHSSPFSPKTAKLYKVNFDLTFNTPPKLSKTRLNSAADVIMQITDGSSIISNLNAGLQFIAVNEFKDANNSMNLLGSYMHFPEHRLTYKLVFNDINSGTAVQKFAQTSVNTGQPCATLYYEKVL